MSLFIQLLYYNSIYTCKVYKYHRVKENTSYKSLRRFFFGSKKLDEKVYRKLTDELIDEFGVTNDAKRIYYIEKNRLMFVCRYYINNDRTMIGKIQYKNKELEELKEKQSKALMKDDIRKVHSRNYRIIGNWSGNNNVKNLSIFDFYNYLKDYEAEQSTKMQVA